MHTCMNQYVVLTVHVRLWAFQAQMSAFSMFGGDRKFFKVSTYVWLFACQCKLFEAG